MQTAKKLTFRFSCRLTEEDRERLETLLEKYARDVKGTLSSRFRVALEHMESWGWLDDISEWHGEAQALEDYSQIDPDEEEQDDDPDLGI